MRKVFFQLYTFFAYELATKGVGSGGMRFSKLLEISRLGRRDDLLISDDLADFECKAV